ncbi:aminotransferase class IV [Kaistella palustris]|uniref:aminotransferase class IV n=1 Tax=Kaistella palustris TaxID=493376 RepID=UPI00041B9561|nr:aminotransferase class IV [Kaistella palustris]
MNTVSYFSDDTTIQNRAFLAGDSVKVFFFVRNSQLIMDEECYFFLMASMRKLRMQISLTYTLEFFRDLFQKEVLAHDVRNGIIHLMAYRNSDVRPLEKAAVAFYFKVEKTEDVLKIRSSIEVDLIKEVNVNRNFLSSIRTPSAENIYAEIYAAENELDDVIFLNPEKRIARSIYGNYLFLEGNIIKIPKQSEGAYISPLMENFVTFLHKNALAEIQESEMIAFESQKAEEILMISDEKGIFTVRQIRKKTFDNTTFTDLVAKWRASFL